MECELAAKTRHGDGQQARLRERESTGPPYGGIRRVVVIGDNHVVAVVTAEKKDANQSFVVPRLRERVQETEPLKGQNGCTKCATGSTQKLSPGQCHFCAPFTAALGTGGKS